MSLAAAIKQTMDAHGLATATVARRLNADYDRATFYRLLNGATTEPRLGTLLGLCRILEISPTELAELAGLWPFHERPADALDVRMRAAFAQLQLLPPEDKRRAVSVVACLAQVWETASDSVASESVSSAPEPSI